jgi:hypothetical protein
MSTFTYFQLSNDDGTPRLFYRTTIAYHSNAPITAADQEEEWSPTKNAWVPTTQLFYMLTHGEMNLDKISANDANLPIGAA